MEPGGGRVRDVRTDRYIMSLQCTSINVAVRIVGCSRRMWAPGFEALGVVIIGMCSRILRLPPIWRVLACMQATHTMQMNVCDRK